MGAIAQLGERYNGIVEVVGSIPIGSTTLPSAFIRINEWQQEHQCGVIGVFLHVGLLDRKPLTQIDLSHA